MGRLLKILPLDIMATGAADLLTYTVKGELNEKVT